MSARNLESEPERDTFINDHDQSISDSPSSSSSATRLLHGSEQDNRNQPDVGHEVSTRRHAFEPQPRSTPVGFIRRNPSIQRVEQTDIGNVPRRMHSPQVGGGPSRLQGRNASHGSPSDFARRGQQDFASNEVFLPSGSSQRRNYRVSVTSIPDMTRADRHSRTSSVGSISYISRSSSVSEAMQNIPLRETSLAEEALNAPRISSRASGRQSIGQEWTRHHWDKLKDLEQESERARRCSKLSSGFAPLMVFGGLVFVCIGISASTNTGKDKERLKQLSAAPMAMGVFMLALGLFLIATWFGCRARARQLDRKVLHGSRRNSLDDDNLVEAVLAKLYGQMGSMAPSRARRPETPTLPGVTMEGVIVHKEQNTNSSSSRSPESTSVTVVRETSV
uniref:Uncharacterized protein LOC100182279 n=1 Tax=Phallusia mammillata TaxID=59560 RepID=A0A6F9DI65_9ASCI|nr:uncharacterized protein LOC100182279 [Phallusia mammillata]